MPIIYNGYYKFTNLINLINFENFLDMSFLQTRKPFTKKANFIKFSLKVKRRKRKKLNIVMVKKADIIRIAKKNAKSKYKISRIRIYKNTFKKKLNFFTFSDFSIPPSGSR